MPDYPSVMNYLYQVAGLTDSLGVEHIDYSYGLELPLSEGYLSSAIPMGIQNYKVRYFGPYNAALDTPGQASKVFCSGDLLNTGSIPGEGQYVLLEGPTVSTPDWSNGTVPLGKLIKSGLDINFDGTGGQTFTDSPDWLSLNLQQVGARANAFAASADLGKSDGGTSDLGKSDGGTSDLGKSDGGTSQLGADALGDANFASIVLSGSLGPPTNLTVAVYVPPASTSGGTGNALNWTGNTGVASSYNIYRCNASISASCTPTQLASTSSTSGNPAVVTPAYTDLVNDFVHAGSTCPSNSTCYNTAYNYYVTEVNTTTPGIPCTLATCSETGASSTMPGEVNHMFVVANSQTITYGATNPTPTYTVYSNVAAVTSLAGVTCAYTPSPLANSKGYYDAGNYPITCNGPTVVSGTEGVNYYAAATPALFYPTSLGGTVVGITQGSLTINQLPITVTAVYSTKVYNATTAASPTAIPTITTNSLVSGDMAAFTESYDNPNVNTTVASHVMTPAGSVNDNNNGNNYKVTFVNSLATSVITRANASVTPNANTKTYGMSDPVPLTTGTLTGFFSVDGVTATYSRTPGESVLGGPYTISATLSATPVAPAAGLSNYNITYNTANFTITPKAASVTPNPASKTYGATDPPLSGTVAGFVASDNVTATYSRTAGETVAGSPYTISATLSPAGVLGNYNITYNTAPFTINKANASVAPNPAGKTYGASDSPLTGTLTGFLAADGVSATYSRVAGETPGSYTISATLSPTGVLGNYNITYNTASFAISPASTVTTISTVNPSPATVNQPVTVTVAVAPQFTGTPTGSVTVNSSPAGVSCTVASLSSATGSCQLTFTTLDLEYITATYSGDSNFSSSMTSAATPLTVNGLTATITAANKPYDGNTNATITSCTLAGVAPADVGNVTCSASGAAFKSAGPGTGLTVTANVSLGGMAAGNYVLASNTATTTANINPDIDFTTLVLNGSAAPAAPVVLTGPPAVLQLTNDVGGEASSAWLPINQSVASSFSTSFDFLITQQESGPNSIADGFAFVIQAASNRTSTRGVGGGYLGYGGIANSLAIEFDTYENTEFDDPSPASVGGSDAHVGIQSLGTQPNSPDHTTPYSMGGANLGGPVLVNFADGGTHNATITYDGSTLSVFVDGSFVVSASVNLNNLLGLNGGPAYFGFTAGTGANEETSKILDWSIN
jgi:hypothetical protein